MPTLRPTRLRRMLACPPHARTFAVLLLGEAALCLTTSLTTAWPRAAALWLTGLLLWTLLEYLLHRFAFHLPPTHPLGLLGARQHHDHHTDARRLPITKPLLLTLPALLLGYLAASLLLGSLVTPLWSGLLAGYLAYELMHVAAHTLAPGEHPLARSQATHLDHHRDITRNFGITSPLWDHILGTATGPRACRREVG